MVKVSLVVEDPAGVDRALEDVAEQLGNPLAPWLAPETLT